MRNLYWVGGSGTWDGSSTTHWSISSGGASGEASPTLIDNVFFDSNSGLAGQTVSVSEQVSCKNFSSQVGSDYTQDMTGGQVEVYGSLVVEVHMLGVDFQTQFDFQATSPVTITSNGCQSISYVNLLGANGRWTLQDNLYLLKDFYQENGTFDANGFGVRGVAIEFDSYDADHISTVYMRSGLFDCKFFDVYPFDGFLVNIDPGTSMIKLSNTSGLNDSPNFVCLQDGISFNDLWIVEAGTGGAANLVYGSDYFNSIKTTPGLHVNFESGKTTTLGALDISGTLGNLTTFGKHNGSDFHTFSRASGTVACDYLSLSYSHAQGGARWYAGSHSTDGGNNTGWIFSDVPIPPIPPGPDITIGAGDKKFRYEEETKPRQEKEIRFRQNFGGKKDKVKEIKRLKFEYFKKTI